jgi:hypothetical protein
MSEYYRADRRADDRAQQKRRAQEAPRDTGRSQDVKITLLGDFLFPSDEPRGCDPYNSVQGKTARRDW